MRHVFAAPLVLTAALAHADPRKTRKGEPVYQTGDACYTYGLEQVQCPPNLVVPEADPTLDGSRISFDEALIGCSKPTESHCESSAHRSCNPPAPTPVACPKNLLPRLAKGVKPTRRKGKACYYGKVKVVCP